MPAAAKPTPPSADESRYPTVERFIERAAPDEIPGVFADTRSALEGVKGPKADHAKKVKVAIERTEELLTFLVDVREKLIAEKKSPKRR